MDSLHKKQRIQNPTNILQKDALCTWKQTTQMAPWLRHKKGKGWDISKEQLTANGRGRRIKAVETGNQQWTDAPESGNQQWTNYTRSHEFKIRCSCKHPSQKMRSARGIKRLKWLHGCAIRNGRVRAELRQKKRGLRFLETAIVVN